MKLCAILETVFLIFAIVFLVLGKMDSASFNLLLAIYFLLNRKLVFKE